MKPPSIRTTISCNAVRRILLRVSAVAAGCDQASSRSAPSCIRCRRSFSPRGAGFFASSSAISPSSRCTTCNASFQRVKREADLIGLVRGDAHQRRRRLPRIVWIDGCSCLIPQAECWVSNLCPRQALVGHDHAGCLQSPTWKIALSQFRKRPRRHIPPHIEATHTTCCSTQYEKGMSTGCGQLIPTTTIQNRRCCCCRCASRFSTSNAPRWSVSLCQQARSARRLGGTGISRGNRLMLRAVRVSRSPRRAPTVTGQNRCMNGR